MNLLTEQEKEYLAKYINYFRDEIVCITKITNDSRNEFIAIRLKDGTTLYLLILKCSTRSYKGMILDKEYSLEELGL